MEGKRDYHVEYLVFNVVNKKDLVNYKSKIGEGLISYRSKCSGVHPWVRALRVSL